MYRHTVIGDIIGQYEVLRTLGEGGIARVYLVKHRKLGTRHALKILHYRSDVMAKRLLQEGRIQAQLRHPNIVQVLDFDDTPPAPFLVQEHCGGGTLVRRTADAPLPGDTIPAVPEPSTWAMAALGLLMVALRARQRR